jgi:hypothetical protein
MADIISQIVLMMWQRTLSNTEPIVQVHNRIAREATLNSRTVAGLAIQVAHQAFVR